MEDDLSDLPPFTPEELELMWKYAPPRSTAQTSSTTPKVMQFQDVPTESAEPDPADLTHFTPKQIANLWSATMKMQREAYTAYQSQQKQLDFLKTESIQLSDAVPVCSAFNRFHPAPSQDFNQSAHFTDPPLTTNSQQLGQA